MRLDNQDGVSLTTETSDANLNASLSQDWLNVADAEERVIRNLPRVVASLPKFQREGEPKRAKKRSRGGVLLRGVSSYTATFLLGGACVAFGARFFAADVEKPAEEPAEQLLAQTSADDSGLSLDSLAFERAQETPRVSVSKTPVESPLRFNDSYDPYADVSGAEQNNFAPQTDVPKTNSDARPQIAREEESFPTWADLESSANDFPVANQEFDNDDYSTAANPIVNSATTSYETARPNDFAAQNYQAAPNAPASPSYNTSYAQTQNSTLRLSAPNVTQYASNVANNDYNQNAGYNQNANYNGNNAVNSNVNQEVYATNAGNTNYNRERELDDFTTSNVTNEGFGSYNMNSNVASDVPVFEDRQTGYGASENNYASSVDGSQSSNQGIDRSFIPTFGAPNPAPSQVAPSSSNATYVAQNREEASNSAPIVSPGRPLRW